MNQRRATEERILGAAVQLFATKGFNGTSTREIARLADVNETSLFRHFPRKQDLFWAAMELEVSRLRMRKELRKALAENKPPETVVPLVIEFLVEAATYRPELIRMLRFSLLEMRPGSEAIYRQRLGPMFNSVMEYLRNYVASDGEKPAASILTTGLFMTALGHDTLFKLFTGDSITYDSTEEKIAIYSRFWLKVLSSPNLGQSSLKDGVGAYASRSSAENSRSDIEDRWSTSQRRLARS